MMRKNSNTSPELIALTGKTKKEIISILGNKYSENPEGSMIYATRIFFTTKKMFISFNDHDIVEIVYTE